MMQCCLDQFGSRILLIKSSFSSSISGDISSTTTIDLNMLVSQLSVYSFFQQCKLHWRTIHLYYFACCAAFSSPRSQRAQHLWRAARLPWKRRSGRRYTQRHRTARSTAARYAHSCTPARALEPGHAGAPMCLCSRPPAQATRPQVESHRLQSVPVIDIHQRAAPRSESPRLRLSQ